MRTPRTLDTQLTDAIKNTIQATASLRAICLRPNPDLGKLDVRAKRLTLVIAELRIAIRAITLRGL